MDFSDDLFLLPITEGGGEGDFSVLPLKDYTAAKPDVVKKAIILVDETVDKSAEIDKVTGITVDPTSILAINGPAVDKILTELPATHKLVQMVFKNDTNIKSIDGVVPQQIVFLLMFHQLFFLGTADGSIKIPFSSSFKDKFNAVLSVYEKPEFDTYKEKLSAYFTTVQNEHVKASDDRISYDTFRGTLIGGIRRVVAYIQSGVVDTNANTVTGYENIQLPENNENYDNEEEGNTPESAELKEQIKRLKAELEEKNKEVRSTKEDYEKKAKKSKEALEKSIAEVAEAKAQVVAVKGEKEALLHEAQSIGRREPGVAAVLGKTAEIQDLKERLAAAERKLGEQSGFTELKNTIKELEKEKKTLLIDNDFLKSELAKVTEERDDLKTKVAKTVPRPKRVRTRKLLGKNQDDKNLVEGDPVVVRWGSEKNATHPGKVRAVSLKQPGKFIVQEYKDDKPVLRADGMPQVMRPVAKEDIKKV